MDSDPLPQPPAEVIRLLRQAAEVADAPDRETFQKLYKALTSPTMPSAQQVVAGFTGEGQLSVTGVANAGLSRPEVSLTGGVVTATSDSFGSAEVARDAIAKTIAYSAVVTAMGGAAYSVAHALDMASQVIIRWLEFLGH